MTLNDETLFVWHESNPGIAKFFVYEIVDGDDKVIFSAQTTKKFFHLSAANLATLPRIETPPAMKIATTPKTTAPPSSIELAKASVPAMKPGDPIALDAAMKKAGPSAVKNGVARAVIAHRMPEAGEMYWRVRGMANKIDVDTGKKLGEIVQAEDSPDRPILLPLPPNGFSCDAGTPGSHLGKSMFPRFFPTIYTYAKDKRPKPCPGDSMNICSLADYAEFAPDARLDLSRLPFDIQQKGDLNSSAEVTFQNVFIDWGDGSEPKPLKIRGNLTKAKQSLKSVHLVSPGDDENKRVRHLYINDDKDAEFVVYKVRIFSLADPDKTPPYTVGGVSKSEAKPMGSLTLKGLGSQSAAASTSTAPPAAATPAAATADVAQVKTSLSPKMFTIACIDVQVWNPWGVGADEPLHLLTADIVFPTDSDEAKAVIRSKGGKPGLSAKPIAVKKPTTGVSSKAAAREVDLGPTPEISDCSSAFKAGVQLTYWGHGKVKLTWTLDGTVIETTELPSELPPVSTADGEKGKKPYFITMTSALPAVLQTQPHRLQVHADAVKITPRGAKSNIILGPTQSSGLQVNQKIAPGAKAALPTMPPGLGAVTPAKSALPTFIAIVPEPGSEVESDPRYYKVFDHKTKGLPCALRYFTASTGTFEISDLSALTKSTDTYSGIGMLKLYFPSYDGSVNSLQPVKVNFSGLTLAPAADETEDVLDIKAGTITQSVGPETAIIALNFPVRLTKVSLTPEKLTIDGNVRLNSGMGFTNATIDELPRWEFATAPLSSEGDFFASKTKDVETELGASQFDLKISSADIDFSKKQGSAPVQPCGSPASGATWQGIRIKGVLAAPDTLESDQADCRWISTIRHTRRQSPPLASASM